MSEFSVLNLPVSTFEDLEAECVIVDHRSEDSEIVESVASWIHPDNGSLQWEEEDEAAYLIWRGEKQRIPLTYTSHDRYVTISSIAYILRDVYDLWLLKERLGDDTHSLLLLPKADSSKLEASHPQWTADTLVRLDLGYDYFGKIRVPYVQNENHNPHFLEDAARIGEEHRKFVEAMSVYLRERNAST